MTVVELQDAKLEPSGSRIDDDLASLASSVPTPTKTDRFTAQFSILEQIKRTSSAGSTPMMIRKNKGGMMEDTFDETNNSASNGFVNFASNLTESISNSSEELFSQTFTSMFKRNKKKNKGTSSSSPEKQQGNKRRSASHDYFYFGKRSDDTDDDNAAVGFYDNWGSGTRSSGTSGSSNNEEGTTTKPIRRGIADTTSKPKTLLNVQTMGTVPTCKTSPLDSKASYSWEDSENLGSTSLLDDDDDEDDFTATSGRTNEEDNTTYCDNDTFGDDICTLDGDDFDDISLDDPGPIAAVGSFLDELADVDGVTSLGHLLYQVGSCNYTGAACDNAASGSSSRDDYYCFDDGSVTIHSELEEPPKRGRSMTPRSSPPPKCKTAASSDNPLSDAASAVTAKLSNLSMNLSMKNADSILSVHAQDDNNNGNHNNVGGPTPGNTPIRSFLNSVFSCNG